MLIEYRYHVRQFTLRSSPACAFTSCSDHWSLIICGCVVLSDGLCEVNRAATSLENLEKSEFDIDQGSVREIGKVRVNVFCNALCYSS